MNSISDLDISVILITYNQERYIADALDSILMQKTSYSVEVLVGEDCSPDSTKDVLKKYEADYPGRLTVIYNKNNLGATRNLYQLLAIAKGRYITLLEGDDYWLGEDRLKTLCGFLDTHPECYAVSHKRERRDQNGKLFGHDPDDSIVGKYLTLDEFMSGKLYSAMGCMFRNAFHDGPEYYEKALTSARNACDLVLCHIMLHNGDVFVLDRCFGVYRALIGDGSSNYCSIVNQLNVDADRIVQIRGIIGLYGNNGFFRKQIAESAFDAVMYCTKRKMKSERKQFLKSLNSSEIFLYIYCLPLNLLRRLLIHKKRSMNG